MTDQALETTEINESPAELKPHHIAALGKALIAHDDDQKAGKGGGWRKTNQIGGLKNCDDLVAMGYYEPALENSADHELRHDNRFRITESGIAALVMHYQAFDADTPVFFAGDEVELAEDNQPPFVTAITSREGQTGRYSVKGRSGKYWPVELTLIQRANKEAHIAALTSPEVTATVLDAVRAAAADLEDGSFCDSDSLTVDDAPDTDTDDDNPLTLIDGLIAETIGDTHPVEIHSTIDNVRAMVAALWESRAQIGMSEMAYEDLKRENESLKTSLSQARRAVPAPNELTEIRAHVAKLEEENARLSVENDDLILTRNILEEMSTGLAKEKLALREENERLSAATTIPEIEVKFIFEDVSHPGGRVQAGTVVENYINQGWVVKYESVDNDGYYTRLQRNKPATPDQPHRAAAEVTITHTVENRPHSQDIVSPNRIIISTLDPAAVPMNNALSVCGDCDDAFVDMSDYSTALDRLMAGQITPAQLAEISDRRALTVGFNTYRQAMTS